ncbi:hypothetical protein [Pseudomonas cichorii]|uniref:hypothetical protein n=1 Tax=Pseudomonas cichorii TaxID=36746 RepID=UPI0013C2AB42|nr:hypothetical protein [Pseudomonas cichorii]QVE16922.1 hypothetical protein KGD89_24355 [Pseudomonas cichorii]
MDILKGLFRQKKSLIVKSKKPPTPSGLIDKIEKLFNIASKTSALPISLRSKVSIDKLFELQVLWRVLRAYSRQAGTSIKHVAPLNGKGLSHEVVIALSPASANRKKFSHFLMSCAGSDDLEAWISVEAYTLSWFISQSGLRCLPQAHSSVPPAAYHELDVGVFKAGIALYPSHEDICLAVSCKNVRSAQKECVREALGLRRETAYLSSRNDESRAPWLVRHVPNDPPSPVFLYSSDPGIRKYQNPVDQHGVYVRYSRFLG